MSITDVRGIEVGHAERWEALTGCSVVLCRQGAVVGVDVRGLAPGTRETDLCRPGTLVEKAHGILLTGGSAFGLEAAAGVMRFLWERDIGFDAGAARVPIVPGAVIFDLGLGEVAWPDAALGYAACAAATVGSVVQGCVGAGTGASVGKFLGPAQATKSGLGTASLQLGELTVGALVAVNALGNVVLPGSETVVAGARDPASGTYVDSNKALLQQSGGAPVGNTTVGVVATDAELDADAVSYLARVAHDGLARTIRPVHTLLDGDAIFALATGRATAGGRDLLLPLAVAVVQVVERAVVNAVRHASPAGGLPASAYHFG